MSSGSNEINTKEEVIVCPKCPEKQSVPKSLVKVECHSCGHIWTHNGTGHHGS